MLKKLLNNKISSKTLGLFRIAYSLVLLFEVLRLYKFRFLIFDKVPYFEPSEIPFTYIFLIWLMVIVFIIIGLRTKTATLINYIISIFLIGGIRSYEYHMFHTYMGINFLLCILPTSKSYSLDNLFEKINKSTLRKEFKINEIVPEFYYYIILLTGIGFVYLDSIFYKLCSPLWINGLGMWLPASVPFAVNIDSTSLLNQELLMKFLGYFTIFFEAIFIFLFWKRKFKLIFFTIGIALHIGIYLLYPIPQFALGVMAIYVLMLPPNLTDYFRLKKVKNKLLFFYDNE